MARIQVKDLLVDESLDAKALSWIWGGKGPSTHRARGIVAARDLLSMIMDRSLERRPLK
jgi:hypothetical protein